MCSEGGASVFRQDDGAQNEVLEKSHELVPAQDAANSAEAGTESARQEATAEQSPAEATGGTAGGEKAASFPSNQADSQASTAEQSKRKRRVRARRKDAFEAALQGRRELCYRIRDITPRMLKMVMTRVASSCLPSVKRLTQEQLANELVRCAPRIADKGRIAKVTTALDPDRDRRTLKGIIVFEVLLEEERYALRVDELNHRVIEYEKQIVKEAKACKLLDAKEQDKNRLAAYETYNVVLDAAWRHEDKISVDEANLLSELRSRLSITVREHRLLEAKMGRFPKRKCGLHSVDQIEEAKRQLQREGILWTFRDENGKDIDAIPAEIMELIRTWVKKTELQKANYKRLLANKAWSNSDFLTILRGSRLDSRGNRSEMADRILASRLTPSQILGTASLSKLQALCREVGLVSYGRKPQVIRRLIDFYDNLTFEPPVVERDERAQWYAAYELLAARKYSQLKAQGLIEKQEHVDTAFEKATDFLFEERLKLPIEKKLPVKSADGKVYLHDRRQVVLWDCKSDEKAVNLQDHLESQFDGYMRAEARQGYRVLYFLVIGPRFTKKSSSVARKYKMATSWDVPLITASALKRIAEKWHDANPDHPFPIGLLNLTDIVDDDRADELLSLVL